MTVLILGTTTMTTIITNPKNRNVSLLRRSSLFLSLVTEEEDVIDFLPFIEEGDTVFIAGLRSIVYPLVHGNYNKIHSQSRVQWSFSLREKSF
jgi:hypothetical protein